MLVYAHCLNGNNLFPYSAIYNISIVFQEYCLPVIDGKHSDLKSITAETMAKVLNKEYDDTIEKTVIVDCRYPYEYEGGHIKGAINLYTHKEILDEFIHENGHLKYQSKDSSKRTVIIFHCEFSSERGPRMSRFLRNTDRDHNKESYPNLHYPELYLLHNGYKEFYHNCKVNRDQYSGCSRFN